MAVPHRLEPCRGLAAPQPQAGPTGQSRSTTPGRSPTGSAGPDEDLLRSEDRRRLARAVDGLEDRYRAVIELLYFQGLPYEQIAAVLDVPVEDRRDAPVPGAQAAAAAAWAGGGS